ncbi:MAG: hypothetical protein V1839_00335 [archaeon]
MDLLPPGPFVPMSPPMQRQQAPQQMFAPKQSPAQLDEVRKKVSELVSDLNGRIRLLEERTENLRSHLDMLDASSIEKHKETISEIRNIEDGQRALRADMDMLKDVVERLTRRLDAFASKEEVKVLQRYVELWQPMNFVTRPELKNAVQSILKMLGFKIKEHKEE